MRTLLGFLTVVAVSIQNADSWNTGSRSYEVIRTDGPHPEIKLQWEGSELCVMKEVQMDDPTGRQRIIDLSDQAQPYLVKSTDEFPTAHWISYTVWFRYECDEIYLFFIKKVRVWEELSVNTGNGEPLPLQNLGLSTESSSATVRWGVPDLIKHSPDRVCYRVQALLHERGDCPSEPRRMTPTLEGPLVVKQLAPGVVYTVVLFLEIQGHQSEPIETTFIVDALKEQTTLDVSVNRTETTAELVWGSTKKQNLSSFIDHYSIEGAPFFSYMDFLKREKKIVNERRFTINNLTGSDKFRVVIQAYLRCGNRIIDGARNTVYIEALRSSPPDSWELMYAGVALGVLASILIVIIVVLSVRLLSKRRGRKRIARAEQKACFSTIPTLTRHARYDESQPQAESSASPAGRTSVERF